MLGAGALILSGCGLIQSRAAARAYNEYQAALAVGDLPHAHAALLKLVRADEDEPDYWVELGKMELRLGNYAEAYQALSRAHELDRNNVQVLATLTQMALVSGQIDLADQQARTLGLLAPDDPTVALVRGYVALKSGNLDKADAEAQGLLTKVPNDSSAKILRARILVAARRIDDAIAVLQEQFASTPDDVAAARGLISLYRGKEDWRSLAHVQYALSRLAPGTKGLSVQLVESLLRGGQIKAAGDFSRPMLEGSADPRIVEQLLDDWANFAPTGTALPEAGRLAQASNGNARVSFANYFNRLGAPRAAQQLLGGPRLPVTPANARSNAVLAQALDAMRQGGQALDLYNLVLQTEPDQVDALRGRSILFARMGRGRQAIADAQRLVSAEPNSGRDRLVLADAFTTAGKGDEARRTLWDAFQDLPNDDKVFAALRRLLLSKGDADGATRLADERVDRRLDELSQELL
jgi:tetratricopeptide (TPR) repeat protein